MSYSFDLEWDLIPLGGETGQSYKGVKDNQQVFVKRNTTPFLTAVSGEGIAPKLLWTKRTAHGEDITAQEWIESRELTPVDMVQIDVLHVVKSIHTSRHLNSMLSKTQGNIMLPVDFLNDYLTDLQVELKHNHFLGQVVDYLKNTAENVSACDRVVCHGDLTHSNFLLTKQSRLYVVDWETVRFADPISDIAQILCDYVDRKDWLLWLETYGLHVNADVLARLEWYCLFKYLMNVKKYHFQGHLHMMNHNIMMLKNLLGKDSIF